MTNVQFMIMLCSLVLNLLLVLWIAATRGGKR
jgi:hypothetical protein